PEPARGLTASQGFGGGPEAVGCRPGDCRNPPKGPEGGSPAPAARQPHLFRGSDPAAFGESGNQEAPGAAESGKSSGPDGGPGAAGGAGAAEGPGGWADCPLKRLAGGFGA